MVVLIPELREPGRERNRRRGRLGADELEAKPRRGPGAQRRSGWPPGPWPWPQQPCCCGRLAAWVVASGRWRSRQPRRPARSYLSDRRERGPRRLGGGARSGAPRLSSPVQCPCRDGTTFRSFGTLGAVTRQRGAGRSSFLDGPSLVGKKLHGLRGHIGATTVCCLFVFLRGVTLD